MELYNDLPAHIKEVDVIIAGGGTAGCVIATRLAQADPTLSILVLERGANNNVTTVTYPALFLANLQPTADVLTFWQGRPEEQLNGRSLVVPTGGILGGGSSGNFMMYSRAQRSDMYLWDVPGWTAEDLIPFWRKMETHHGPGGCLHGQNGPINVSRGTYSSPRIEEQLISVANKFGIPETPDLQSFETANGIQRAYRYISPSGGREDAATRYLHPLLQGGEHPNLRVIVQTEVLRVLFDNDRRAIGVEFRPNPAVRDGPVRTVTAKQMVVVSSGALGSPGALERSGIGATDVLEQASIPLVAQNGEVGKNFQDHHIQAYPYHTDLAFNETLDPLAQGRLNPGELIQNNDPILGWNGQDVIAKIRPTEGEVATLGPDFQEAWNREFQSTPDRPLAILTGISGFAADPSLVDPGQYFTITAFTLYPFSRGHVHITSSEPRDQLDFKTGFFTSALDVTKHVWVYKKQREIVRRMPLYRGEVAFMHPPFPAGSQAEAKKRDGPLPEDVADIVYTAEDDAILEEWLRQNVATTWHSLGTCKMASAVHGDGVVDEKLSVNGVTGLKVADLSIIPSNVAANTNGLALMVGEKAASIFVEELKIENET